MTLPLQEHFKDSGARMFRLRGVLPFLLLPLIAGALPHGESLERAYGEMSQEVWEISCLILSLLGLAVRCHVNGHAPAGTSGRNTRRQLALQLNSSGMYSLVRHPLYLGNYLIFLGFTMFIQVWWLPVICTLCFWLYYERIMFAEESFLRESFGGDYLQWAERTPAIFPSLTGYERPSTAFSWRNILRREYTTQFLIFSVFPLLDTLTDRMVEKEWHVDNHWAFFFLASFSVYATLRILKKHTTVLKRPKEA